jgi:hypothetical protein
LACGFVGFEEPGVLKRGDGDELTAVEPDERRVEAPDDGQAVTPKEGIVAPVAELGRRNQLGLR